jgi:hypothetical protein
MKKASPKSGTNGDKAPEQVRDEIRPHYDFRGGVRGKYAKRYREGTNVVLLEPDVAARFPNAGAVNRALRALAEVADETKPTRRPRRRTA